MTQGEAVGGDGGGDCSHCAVNRTSRKDTSGVDCCCSVRVVDRRPRRRHEEKEKEQKKIGKADGEESERQAAVRGSAGGKASPGM